MNRIGNHHMAKRGSPFQTDVQNNPRVFLWEILKEDDLKTREFERNLIREHANDPLMYNLHRWTWRKEEPLSDGPRWGKETREKMRESAKKESSQPAHKKAAQSRAVSETNSKKQPCPQCGMLMNIGNLAKHLKGTKCSGVKHLQS